jgi:type IV pilus assembly protein PilE
MAIKRNRGFTLLEILTVVVIVGILAAIALPAYQEQIRKQRRATAETHLMDIAAHQQTYLLDSRGYAPDLATLSMTTPSEVSQYYTISVTNSAGPPPTFTITATPTGAQAADLGGAALTIDNSGAKTPSGAW